MPEKKTRETRKQRNERLSQTDRGRALLSIINEAGNCIKLANLLGIHNFRVGQWVHRGFISMRYAQRLAEITGRERSEFRPDLSDADWERAFAGPAPGQKPKHTSADSQLLIELAEKHGSVAKLCEKAYITVGDYHTWKSRGRIPAIKYPALVALK